MNLTSNVTDNCGGEVADGEEITTAAAIGSRRSDPEALKT
jgi:hypothetical protein